MTAPNQRPALVTGAGRGIGRACALALVRRGAAVALLARTKTEIDAVAAEIRAAGGRAHAAPCDVTDRGAVETAVRDVARALGGLHIVVNNAGQAESAAFAKTTPELWNRMLAANLTSAFHVTQAALPHLREAGWGRIVNVASTAALTGYPYTAAYTASKHGLLGLTRALARELAGTGITVNAICPSYVDTDMTRRSIENITARTGRTPAEARKALEAANPQKRLLTPEEVAAAVAFLASDEAGGISGAALPLDGAETA